MVEIPKMAQVPKTTMEQITAMHDEDVIFEDPLEMFAPIPLCNKQWVSLENYNEHHKHCMDEDIVSNHFVSKNRINSYLDGLLSDKLIPQMKGTERVIVQLIKEELNRER